MAILTDGSSLKRGLFLSAFKARGGHDAGEAPDKADHALARLRFRRRRHWPTILKVAIHRGEQCVAHHVERFLFFIALRDRLRDIAEGGEEAAGFGCKGSWIFHSFLEVRRDGKALAG